jgi:RNA polymerase sigma-70 factor, ECF subfamily
MGSSPARSTRRRSGASNGCEEAHPLIDEAAIREFLATQYPRLVAAVTFVAGSRAAAEDAVQEALARAWERSQRGERIDSLGAWVTRVAMNLSRSRLRRLRAEMRARERIVAMAAPERSIAALTGDRVDVERALAALPRRQREATVLRYYLGFDLAEVAEVLGVHEGTAKTTMFRARRALATTLGDRNEEEENDGARL